MKICIFGSSFNPPHIAHGEIVCKLKEMKFDRLLVVPTGNPNHKKLEISTNDRVALVDAFAKQYDVEVSYHEIENNFEYTVESLHYLDFPKDDQIFFTIGGDSVNDLPSWDFFNQLKAMVTFIIFNRSDIKLDDNILAQINYTLVDFIPTDVSSTKLRSEIDQSLIPELVYEQIKKRGLYNIKK